MLITSPHQCPVSDYGSVFLNNMEGEFEPFKETSHPPRQSNSTHRWDTEQMMSWPTVVNSDKTNQITLEHFMKTFITWYNLNHQHIDLWSPSCIGTSNSYVLQGLSTLNKHDTFRSAPLKGFFSSADTQRKHHVWSYGLHPMACKCTDDVHFVWDCSVWSIGIKGILSVTGPGWLTLEPREREAWS